MRKISAVLLALVMVLTLAACASDEPEGSPSVTTTAENNQETTGGNDDEQDNDQPDEIVGEPLDGSKFMAAIEKVYSDVLAIEMTMNDVGDDAVTEMTVYRSGESMSVRTQGVLGSAFVIITDGVMYSFDEENKTYYETPVGLFDADDVTGQFDIFGEMLGQTQGALITDSGVMEFKGEDYDFEQITTPEGEVTIVFFDEDGNMVGILQDGVQMVISISSQVPDGAFDIPDGYEPFDFDFDFDALFDGLDFDDFDFDDFDFDF
jgi:predicted small lipoprotein YifL